MLSVLELLFGVVAVATVASGCSPPEGGFVEPTEAQKVHFSDHVVVGTVLRRIYPDPYYNDAYKNMTYGALVRVRCTYKGNALGDTITIHGAGIIPGHCTEKSLDADTEYIIMVDGPEGKDQTYSQTYPAEVYSEILIQKFLKVCNLDMKYATENGMQLPRKSCQRQEKLSNCQSYGDGKTLGKPKSLDPSGSDTVEIYMRDMNDTTTTKPGNASPATFLSWILLATYPLVFGLLQ